MKIYIVASNTSRTAIVIAGSKPEAIKIAEKERKINKPVAYEILDYFWDEIKEYEEKGEVYIWDCTEEKKIKLYENKQKNKRNKKQEAIDELT